jgi:hypothetical protein
MVTNISIKYKYWATASARFAIDPGIKSAKIKSVPTESDNVAFRTQNCQSNSYECNCTKGFRLFS